MPCYATDSSKHSHLENSLFLFVFLLYCRPDGRLNLTASAFNQLGQYTSSPGCRGYCYAELAVFFPSGGRNHLQYSLRLPTEGWPG